MKTCTSCNQQKELADFYRGANYTDGYFFECKSCAKQRMKARYQRVSNKVSIERKSYYLENKSRIRLVQKQYQKSNSGYFNAKVRERYASKMTAKPSWANQTKITEIYKAAKAWMEIWPDDPVHVDHIVPIRSKMVSGFHTESNLQIIRASDNLKKHNCYWPDMPHL